MHKAHTLQDAFDDGVIDTTLWVPHGQMYEGQTAAVVIPWFSQANASGGYHSAAQHDLTDSYALVEVTQVLAPAQNAYTCLEARAGGGDTVYIQAGDGLLYLGYRAGGSVSETTVAYSGTAHRRWRIRESGGTTYWEVSPQAFAWTTLRAAPTPVALHAVVLAIGAYITAPDIYGSAQFDNFNVTPPRVPLPDRRDEARSIRHQAAQLEHERPHPVHLNNGEERDYPYVANFSKGLQHDSIGDVVPASYESLLHALTTRAFNDFEAIILGPGGKKLINPQAGLAFDLEGPDTHAVTQPPAPRIDRPRNSAEMAELYWMALARDVHFSDYGYSGIVQQAIQSLNTEFSDFRGPRQGGAVTSQTVFRGIFPGETVGPYISQFLLKGTSDPRLAAGGGRGTADGLITYGDLKIDQRQVTVLPGVDYLTDFPWWLEAQNGADRRGMDAIDGTLRFVRTLRDLGERVHFDNVADHFFNAGLILLHEVPGDQLNGAGVIGRDMEFPFDEGNPYLAYVKQAPFATLGSAHALTVVWELLTRALRAVWFQKWFVHRRLRPEEFGGRIDNQLNGRRAYPIDAEILHSLRWGQLSQHFPSRQGSYLLPQAFPEGAPTHPAYGAGHATGAGACATVLKAFFDESTPIENPLVASWDGLSLVPYAGADAGQMTVGVELNKLAGNIALGRNGAGVHWRSDYDQSLLLGEEIAVRLLQEQSLLLNEPEAYEITRFSGTRIRIHGGSITQL